MLKLQRGVALVPFDVQVLQNRKEMGQTGWLQVTFSDVLVFLHFHEKSSFLRHVGLVEGILELLKFFILLGLGVVQFVQKMGFLGFQFSVVTFVCVKDLVLLDLPILVVKLRLLNLFGFESSVICKL